MHMIRHENLTFKLSEIGWLLQIQLTDVFLIYSICLCGFPKANEAVYIYLFLLVICF